ncbi:MAG: 6-diaminopimelate ligase [Candidatus Tokpelaia sp. JSC189]|nr:MAG: 6-diaminopimelate ligase [Candidatus Tokpelaia sp. JSC189]
MELAEWIKAIDNAPVVKVAGITADSRQVMAGFVFFAIKGNSADGHLYILDAAKQGAIAIVIEKGTTIPNVSVPVLQVDDIRRALAITAAYFYRQQPDVIIAVTGTSGKTSVVSFMREIWGDTGFSAASIGTLGVISPKLVKYASLTTPDPLELHQLLKELAKEGVTHVAIEASSHGIKQRRLDGVHLAAAAFTNLGRDHMDYHATIEDYFTAKMRLFDTLLPKGAPAIIFTDNKYSDKAIEYLQQAKCNVLTVGRKGAFIRIKRVEHERFRQYIEFKFEGDIYEVLLPLAGEFQIINAVVAAGIAIAIGVQPAVVFHALERLKGAPGRLDLVGSTHRGAPVYVDYAHKPDALQNVLKSVRSFTTGRVVLVFGCGGDRDKGKRAIMGKIAKNLADVVIVTDDNPRTENPIIIRKQILIGAPGAIEIGDRRDAIRKAVAMLQPGDTLIIAGKGHEEGQFVGDRLLPFADHVEVHAALEACVK